MSVQLFIRDIQFMSQVEWDMSSHRLTQRTFFETQNIPSVSWALCPWVAQASSTWEQGEGWKEKSLVLQIPFARISSAFFCRTYLILGNRRRFWKSANSRCWGTNTISTDQELSNLRLKDIGEQRKLYRLVLAISRFSSCFGLFHCIQMSCLHFSSVDDIVYAHDSDSDFDEPYDSKASNDHRLDIFTNTYFETCLWSKNVQRHELRHRWRLWVFPTTLTRQAHRAGRAGQVDLGWWWWRWRW